MAFAKTFTQQGICQENAMTQAVDYLNASRASEIASLQRLLRTGELITAISELIHRLQPCQTS